MNTQELQMFWLFYSSDLAFSRAQVVPDWKTREQAETFKTASALLSYYPTNRESTGSDIVDRNSLEAHIALKLNSDMLFKRELRVAKSRLPLFLRIHQAIGASVFFGVYLLLGLGLIYLIVTVIVPTLRGFAKVSAALFLAGYLLLWALYLLTGIWCAVVHRGCESHAQMRRDRAERPTHGLKRTPDGSA